MNHDPGHADRLSKENASLIQERTALKERIEWLRLRLVLLYLKHRDLRKTFR